MLGGDLAENFHDRHPYLRVFGKTVSLTCPVSVGIVLSFHGITAFKFLSSLFCPGSTGEGRKTRRVNSREITALPRVIRGALGVTGLWQAGQATPL